MYGKLYVGCRWTMARHCCTTLAAPLEARRLRCKSDISDVKKWTLLFGSIRIHLCIEVFSVCVCVCVCAPFFMHGGQSKLLVHGKGRFFYTCCDIVANVHMHIVSTLVSLREKRSSRASIPANQPSGPHRQLFQLAKTPPPLMTQLSRWHRFALPTMWPMRAMLCRLHQSAPVDARE